MQLTLDRRVSTDAAAAPDDVRLLKKALNRLGYYTPNSATGITDIADRDMIDALKKFQSAQGLTADGVLLPGDDTMQKMNAILDAQEKDGRVKLIWHCIDDGKSCAACRARNGTMVDDASENTPNCRGNCRCWVTSVGMETPIIYDPPVEKVYPEAILLPLLRGGKLVSIGKNLINAYKTYSERKINITTRQLQKKFKHANIFGIKGNANKNTLQEFQMALTKHVNSPETRVIAGSYHGKRVIYFYNPETQINVITDLSGEFKSGWKLNAEQVENLFRSDKLGGGK